jgi:hypothetical protein
MKTDHPNLGKIYRSYISTRSPLDRKKCPPPLDIARSFEPSAPARMKKRIVDHISVCPMCREEFMMLLEHRRSGEEEVADPAESRPKRNYEAKKRYFNLVAWQGAIVLAGLTLVISSFFLIRQISETSQTRQADRVAISLITPEYGRSLASPYDFRWKGKTGDDYYVMELFDETLMPIWTSEMIGSSRFRLPREVATGLRPGQTYYWMITSYVLGSVSGESQLGRFVAGR